MTVWCGFETAIILVSCSRIPILPLIRKLVTTRRMHRLFKAKSLKQNSSFSTLAEKFFSFTTWQGSLSLLDNYLSHVEELCFVSYSWTALLAVPSDCNKRLYGKKGFSVISADRKWGGPSSYAEQRKSCRNTMAHINPNNTELPLPYYPVSVWDNSFPSLPSSCCCCEP